MFLSHFIGYQFKKKLKHLIVHVTNHCNFRCKHCFIDFSPKNDLPLAKYQELARDVGPIFWLDFGGGEPYLRKDLVEIVTAFDSEVMTIPTNGFFIDRTTAMTKDMVKKVRGELTIALSIDGLQATHDRIREAGSWDKLWKTFEALRAIDGVRVKINTVINKENFSEIIPLMEEVEKRKPDFHSVILLRGTTIDPTFGLPPMEELKGIQEKIFEILGRYTYGQSLVHAQILRNYHRYLWKTSLETIEKKTQVIPCLAGVAHAVVMGNGDVSSCEMLTPIGNIKTQTFPAIWQSAQLEAQKKSIQNKECFCTHNCAMLDSILFRPKSYSSLLTNVELTA